MAPLLSRAARYVLKNISYLVLYSALTTNIKKEIRDDPTYLFCWWCLIFTDKRKYKSLGQPQSKKFVNIFCHSGVIMDYKFRKFPGNVEKKA